MGRYPAYVFKCNGKGCRKRNRCWRYLKPFSKNEWYWEAPVPAKKCEDFIRHRE